jgi:hypothetical protein
MFFRKMVTYLALALSLAAVTWLAPAQNRLIGTPASQPFVTISGNVQGDAVILTATGNSPQGYDLQYSWTARASNPASLAFSTTNGKSSVVTIPNVDGEYFISVTVSDSHGGSFTASRILTRTGPIVYINSVDHFAAWMRNMNIYEVNSFTWSTNGSTFRMVAGMLDKLVTLGVNTIWFTPIFECNGEGMGYWVTDHYKINPAVGTLADLKDLVTDAHSRGIRIIIDLPFSSTNKKHPFFQDCLTHKVESPYANFYIWSGTPGASDYFYLYDWDYLPFLNVAHPDVEKYLQEVAEYWMKEAGLDGFRCDVAWGIEQKNHLFWPRMAERLKNIKPDLFLLGEGPARPVPGSYEDTRSTLHDKSILFDDRFNSVYDWELRGWTEDKGLPGVLTGRASLEELHAILSESYPERALVMRFIENHDVERAAALYGIGKSKLAHALVFTVPGIPLIYGGAETGQSNRWAGRAPGNAALEAWFGSLIRLRKEFISNDATLIRIPNSDPAGVYSYCTRSANGNRVITLLNFRNAIASINLDFSMLSGFSSNGALLTDGFSTSRIQVGAVQASAFPFVLAPYESRVFIVGSDANLIRNGTFDAGMAEWTTFVNSPSAAATGSAENGRFRMSIGKAGTQGWYIQLIQQGIWIEQDKTYELTFQGSADAVRPIDLAIGRDGGAFDSYYRETVNLTTDITTYTRQFRMEQPTDSAARFVVEMGTSDIDVNLDSFILRIKESSSSLEDIVRETPWAGPVFPNPVGSEARVSLTLPKDGRVSVRLIDLNGHSLGTLFEGNLPAGSRELRLEPKGVPDGLCFIEFRFDGLAFKREKLLIMKEPGAGR